MAEIARAHHAGRNDEKYAHRLIPLTEVTVGTRAPQWFFNMTLLLLSPVFFVQLIFMVLPSRITFSDIFCIYECPAATVALYGHLLILLLCYVYIFSPMFIPFERIAQGLFAKIRYRRMHISHLRSDRFKKLLRQRTYTIFVVPAHGHSIPIVVSNSTTTRNIMDRLVLLGLQPRSGYGHTHMLYTSGKQPRALTENECLGDLACVGDLSHFFIHWLTLGGVPSRSPRSSRNQTPDSPARNTRSSMSTLSTPDLPAKNTRSKTRSPRKRKSSVAVVMSPGKSRRRRGDLSDLDVWDRSDDEIIADARRKWKSKAYDHYDITLERVQRRDGTPLHLNFIFTCRHDPQTHRRQTRPRMQTGWGTSNLVRENKKCLATRGVSDGTDTSSGAQQMLQNSVSRYNPARHRALIVLRCAQSKRPFNSVLDPRYLEEVELLRPGTVVPSPSTVSRDSADVYAQGSNAVKNYFKQYTGSIHLAIDGWTAPFAYSYLGIVIIWFAQGKIWRSILEFIRLKESHTGAYLAGVTADCLHRFGLEQKFHSINMDNASNCDTTADHLEQLIPTFRGKASRSRCFAHTVNLIAKAFLAFFHEQPTRKKAPKVSKGSRRNRRGRASQLSASTTTDHVNMDIDPTESMESTGPNTTASTLLADEGNGEEDGDEVDSAKVAHDEAAVKTISGDALHLAAEDGITMTESERSEALGLFPKVAGLARKVHDSPTLQEKFELCMSTSYPNRGNGDDDQKTRLDRRVPTRWNSDFACLKAHVKFQDPIRLLTAGRHGDLEAYALTPSQWKLAEELTEVLVIFQEITDLFSRAEVPLVHEVVPMLEDLEHQLDGVYRDVGVPNVIRIAARAALLMVGKYYALSDDNEVYRIAMAMCPDRKTAWFDNNPDWRSEDREEVKRLLHQRWNESYQGRSAAPRAERASDKQTKGKQRSKWALPPVDIGSSSKLDPDSMDAYLSAPLVPHEEIEAGGGYLQYWERQRTVRPRLAQMALDFLSAPASSVDAERAFSGGRLQMGHLQHGMSSQTFKGQVALGSWIGTPLMPDLDLATTIISSKMKPKRRTDKGKGKENADVLPTAVINVDSDSDVDM